MDEDTLADLKQFITTTVYEATKDFPTRDEVYNIVNDSAHNIVDNAISSLRVDIKVDMDRGFKEVLSAVADVMSQTNDHIFNQLGNHETRITKLEKRPA